MYIAYDGKLCPFINFYIHASMHRKIFEQNLLLQTGSKKCNLPFVNLLFRAYFPFINLLFRDLYVILYSQ